MRTRWLNQHLATGNLPPMARHWLLALMAFQLIGQVWGQTEIRQWADSATASSEYTDTFWSAMQATGPPDTADCGDISTAWAPRPSGPDPEWIELSFEIPVFVTALRIHETYRSGFVNRIDFRDAAGAVRATWAKEDTTPCPGWLEIEIPMTMSPISEVRIYTRTDGWEEIDAAELIGFAWMFEIEPQELDFGTVLIGESKDLMAFITNKNTNSLVLSEADITSPQFSIRFPDLPFLARSGDRIPMIVRFHPICEGRQTAELSFQLREREMALPKVNVSGSGIEATGGQTNELVITKCRVVGVDVLLSFRTSCGGQFVVEWADTLDGMVWQSVTNPVVDTGEVVELIDEGGAAHPQRFYRIRSIPASDAGPTRYTEIQQGQRHSTFVPTR